MAVSFEERIDSNGGWESGSAAGTEWWERLDTAVAGFMRVHGITLLRVALGLVFVWFGALKVVGRSPVEELVADTVYWLPEGFFVPFLGAWEIIVGLGLLAPVALRLTLLLFWARWLAPSLSWWCSRTWRLTPVTRCC